MLSSLKLYIKNFYRVAFLNENDHSVTGPSIDGPVNDILDKGPSSIDVSIKIWIFYPLPPPMGTFTNVFLLVVRMPWTPSYPPHANVI